jgi:hypothetical protein
MIEAKDILGWCFTLAALDFGVFGFLYSVYATASFQATTNNPARPPIVHDLRRFCRAVAAVLVVLTGLSGVATYQAGAGIQIWIIVLCVALLTGFSVMLASKME